jgi:hypothetical protein
LFVNFHVPCFIFLCIVFLIWYVCSHQLKGQTLLCTIKLNVSSCDVI